MAMYSDHTSERPFSSLTIAVLLILAVPCWLMYECGTAVGLIDEEEQTTEAPASTHDPYSVEPSAPTAACGTQQAKIYWTIQDEWEYYTCQTRAQAEDWSKCLPYEEYTLDVDAACPGAQRCCP